MRNMGTQAEACGYGLRETDNTKCIPPSIKPSYKTKSQPIEGRAVEKQVENKGWRDRINEKREEKRGEERRGEEKKGVEMRKEEKKKRREERRREERRREEKRREKEEKRGDEMRKRRE